MSLINQVLKDLEKRHATNSDQQTLPGAVRALPETRDSHRGRVLLTIGVATAIALLAVWWFALRGDSARRPPAPEDPVQP
jgi:hypothetical protein